jgi:hypothetical protein
MDTGFILTRAGRMFEFDVDHAYSADRTPLRPEDPASVVNWEELGSPGIYSHARHAAEQVLSEE